jgi:hypothetical protein
VDKLQAHQDKDYGNYLCHNGFGPAVPERMFSVRRLLGDLETHKDRYAGQGVARGVERVSDNGLGPSKNTSEKFDRKEKDIAENTQPGAFYAYLISAFMIMFHQRLWTTLLPGQSKSSGLAIKIDE